MAKKPQERQRQRARIAEDTVRRWVKFSEVRGVSKDSLRTLAEMIESDLLRWEASVEHDNGTPPPA